jgi:hypothetical protein
VHLNRFKIFFLLLPLFLSSCKKDLPVLLDNAFYSFILDSEEEIRGMASAVTPEGDFITICTKKTNDGKSELFLFKTDRFLKFQWQKNLSASENISAADILITTKGEIFILGTSETSGKITRDIIIIKTDANGNIIWKRSYGGVNEEAARKIIKAADGNFLITGSTKSFGQGLDDVYLIKIDSFGNIIWQKTYGGASFDGGMDILETDDNNILLLGFTDNFGARDRDFWLLKLDARGNIIWDKLYGGDNYEEPQAVIKSSDSNYIIAGHSASFGDVYHDAYAVKVNSDGEIIWQKTYGAPAIHDGAEAAVALPGGGAYIIIRTDHHHHSSSHENSDSENAWIIRIDNNGEIIHDKLMGGEKNDRFQHALLHKESLIVTGFTQSNSTNSAGSFNPWLVKNPLK